MTVTTTTAWISYNSNGSTVNFTVPFQFESSTQLKVYIVSALGVPTLQQLNVDYTVVQALDETGTITFAIAPQNGTRVVIFRQATFVQATPSTGKEIFTAAEVEAIADNLMLLMQECNHMADRALGLGITDVDGSGEYDAQNNRIENLQDPVNAKDAVTKVWAENSVTSQIASAMASAAAAAASAASAAISAAAAQAATGGTFVLRNVAGTANAITALTGVNLSSIQEHQMFKLKPISNPTGPTVISIDTLPDLPLRSPTGAELGADEMHTSSYYDLIAIGSPVTELRITTNF